jgi:hypothetical protein
LSANEEGDRPILHRLIDCIKNIFIPPVFLICVISYNVWRVSEVAEGDLGVDVSPNLIHDVMRSLQVIRVVNRTIRPDLQSSLLDRLHVL